MNAAWLWGTLGVLGRDTALTILRLRLCRHLVREGEELADLLLERVTHGTVRGARADDDNPRLLERLSDSSGELVRLQAIRVDRFEERVARRQRLPAPLELVRIHGLKARPPTFVHHHHRNTSRR